jgi:hypothetical protein
MTRAMVTSRVGSRSLESPSLGNLHNGFGEGREGHTCSALGKPKLTANATRLAPTLHKCESLPWVTIHSIVEPAGATACHLADSAPIGTIGTQRKALTERPLEGINPRRQTNRSTRPRTPPRRARLPLHARLLETTRNLPYDRRDSQCHRSHLQRRSYRMLSRGLPHGNT